MHFWRKSILFYLGGCAYVALELIFRGRSHGSMFLAGGACLVLIGHLNAVKPKLPLFWRSVAGAGIVTMVELAAGLLVNRDYSVWDYRGLPFSYLGQICLGFSGLWALLSLGVLLIHDPLETEIRRLTLKGPSA